MGTKKGTLILLNGTSSTGKSSISRELNSLSNNSFKVMSSDDVFWKYMRNRLLNLGLILESTSIGEVQTMYETLTYDEREKINRWDRRSELKKYLYKIV